MLQNVLFFYMYKLGLKQDNVQTNTESV